MKVVRERPASRLLNVMQDTFVAPKVVSPIKFQEAPALRMTNVRVSGVIQDSAVQVETVVALTPIVPPSPPPLIVPLQKIVRDIA